MTLFNYSMRSDTIFCTNMRKKDMQSVMIVGVIIAIVLLIIMWEERERHED